MFSHPNIIGTEYEFRIDVDPTESKFYVQNQLIETKAYASRNGHIITIVSVA